jgi:group I intron endonuclease
MNDENYSVYWIRLHEHSDVKSEGYVGISNKPKRRFKEHCKGERDGILSNAVRKYGAENLVLDVITEGISFQEAKRLEKELRPKMRIGWNVMTGGSVPPSNKGLKRTSHSEKMKGKNNPFYGKTHSDEVKQILSENMSGEKNPFFGKKRPDHSKKMKEKTGKDYPKFRGFFITPNGKFDSYKTASEKTGIKLSSLYNYCYSSYKTITKLSYSKSTFLQNLGSEKDLVGKTYADIGFGFEHV